MHRLRFLTPTLLTGKGSPLMYKTVRQESNSSPGGPCGSCKGKTCKWRIKDEVVRHYNECTESERDLSHKTVLTYHELDPFLKLLTHFP